MIYTVSEMAKLLNIAPSTLRYYDREGLLPFVLRSKGGIRVFTDEDFRWLKMISCLKSAGMSFKDIRRYIEMAMEGGGNRRCQTADVYRSERKTAGTDGRIAENLRCRGI